jgi:hypothetical protein
MGFMIMPLNMRSTRDIFSKQLRRDKVAGALTENGENILIHKLDCLTADLTR